MFIEEIFELDSLLDYEKQVSTTKEVNITNISYWNASSEYQEYMLKHIKFDYIPNIFNYKYTYDIPLDIRNQIIKKLTGYSDRKIMGLLTSSSSCSIVNMINFLKLNGFKKLCILTPAYFSVEQSCKIFNLSFEKKALIFHNGQYHIPVEYILKNHFNAVWLTSPIYSTGKVYDETQVHAIQELINHQILVIADETLAMYGQELARKLPISNYFYSIYSPHKPLFINSIKFSAILCPKHNDDFLEQWIDVLGGALLHSNITAIMHFLSPNYQLCFQSSMAWYRKSMSSIDTILKQFPFAYYDMEDIGAYKTIYFKTNTYDPDNLEAIKNLIDTKYVSYIPGSYNGFKDNTYHCFRVNLTYNPQEIKNTLYRILTYYT
ncbi:MAG: aminotransferase class I/II-fold pyridoxal phosphate-dependent enzyme [Frisingicoccus sp.]|uniref:aminotransferase class I/II-fold pyridoxal phosphate-dependent enzyme n=1 Tax=Frisingicoccus sp. TaxID=1918627 RepID=UPI00399B4477